MPTNITETDAFPEGPIVAPVGADSRSNASLVVRTFVQILANRTRWAKNRIAEVAKLAEENVFTRTQFVDNSDGPDGALLSTHRTPKDYTNTANRWELITRFPTGDGDVHVAQYVGQGSDHFAFVYNAHWHLPTQKWRADDAAVEAYAYVLALNTFRMSVVPAAAPAWNDWPTSGACDLQVARNVLADRVRADVGMFIDDAAGEYNYTLVRPRTTPIDLADCYGEVVRNPDGSVSSSTGNPIGWRLRRPSVIGDIQLVIEQASWASSLAMLTKRTVNWGTGVVTPLAIATQGAPAASGTHVVTLFTAGTIIDPAAEYQVTFQRAAAGDKVHAIRVIDWLDPGPRNYG